MQVCSGSLLIMRTMVLFQWLAIQSSCGSCIETRMFPDETRHFESDQVWSSYMIPRMSWEYRWESAKDFIDVTFEIYGIYYEVKECGVRLIYEEDEVESSSKLLEWLPDDSFVTDDLS